MTEFIFDAKKSPNIFEVLGLLESGERVLSTKGLIYCFIYTL
jgi:hypothetical protein